jgi:hypothetical protein
MTAALASPLLVPIMGDPIMVDLPVCDHSSAEARKRRREILASQRSLIPDIMATTEPVEKRRKLSIDDESSTETAKASKHAKKPQMKYDPAVPMTKEEAAAWRREQRRKRNRESAAASRQRQRDRINELESELEDWKDKYEDVMAKVRQLEEITGSTPTPATNEIDERVCVTRPETPPPVHTVTQTVTPRASPTSTTSIVSPSTDKVMVKSEDYVDQEEQQEEPTKMISLQAS